jgi:hypothetical protein
VWGDNYFGQVGNRSGNFNPQGGALNVLRGDSLISTGAAAPREGVGTGSNSGSSVIDIDGTEDRASASGPSPRVPRNL